MEPYLETLVGSIFLLDLYMYKNYFQLIRIEKQLEKIVESKKKEEMNYDERTRAINFLSSVKSRDPFIKYTLKFEIDQLKNGAKKNRLLKYLKKRKN